MILLHQKRCEMVFSVRVHLFWVSDKFRVSIHARARSLGSHLQDPFNGLDGESGLTAHGAGLFLAGQLVARFARNTLGGVSVVEARADDSSPGRPGGARRLLSPSGLVRRPPPAWRASRGLLRQHSGEACPLDRSIASNSVGQEMVAQGDSNEQMERRPEPPAAQPRRPHCPPTR